MYQEPHYRFLDRTARPEFQRVRELLECWAHQSPDLVDQQWLGRFRSDDDRHHLGAFFELYVYVLLARQGFKIEREPVSQRGTRVEFVARRDQGVKFQLECTLVAGSDFGSAEQKRINRVYDAINNLESPDFFLGIRRIRAGKHDPSGRRLQAFLAEKLSQLDRDELVDFQASDRPQWTWANEAWEIDFFPIPKKGEARGKPGVRPLGVTTGGAKWEGELWAPLVRALETKASRYGRPDVPYIIAVNALDPFANQDSIVGALFGSSVADITVRRTTADRSGADGFWRGQRGSKHERVSAVLFCPHLLPWTVAVAMPVLWHNPWADHPVDPELWQGPQMVAAVTSGQMRMRPGSTAVELLDLNPDWPHLLYDRDDGRD